MIRIIPHNFAYFSAYFGSLAYCSLHCVCCCFCYLGAEVNLSEPQSVPFNLRVIINVAGNNTMVTSSLRSQLLQLAAT